MHGIFSQNKHDAALVQFYPPLSSDIKRVFFYKLKSDQINPHSVIEVRNSYLIVGNSATDTESSLSACSFFRFFMKTRQAAATTTSDRTTNPIPLTNIFDDSSAVEASSLETVYKCDTIILYFSMRKISLTFYIFCTKNVAYFCLGWLLGHSVEPQYLSCLTNSVQM